MPISDKQRDEINNLGGGWPEDVALGDLLQGDGNGPNGNVRYTGAGTDIDIYVEAGGDDSAAGDSVSSAWATTERVVTDFGFGKYTDKAVTVNYGAGTFRPPRTDLRADGALGIVAVHWKGYRDPNQILVPSGQTFAPKAGFAAVYEATVGAGFSPDPDGFSHFGNLVISGFDLASTIFPSTSPVLEVPNVFATSIDNVYPFTTIWDCEKTGAVIGFPGSAGAVEQHMVTGIKFTAAAVARITAHGLACYGCAFDIPLGLLALNCAFNTSSFKQKVSAIGGTTINGCYVADSIQIVDGGFGNTVSACYLDNNVNAPLLRIDPCAFTFMTLPSDFRNPNAGASAGAIEIRQHGVLSYNSSASTFDGCRRAVTVDGGALDVVGGDMSGAVTADGIVLVDGGRALGISGLGLTAAGSQLVVGELAGQTFASVGSPGVSSPVLLCLATP